MQKTVLICTVGGSHQPIVKAIQALNPEHVCFVCSDDDPATGNKGSYTQITGRGNVIKAHFTDDKPNLPNIPAQLGLAENRFSVLKVQPDDLDDIYRVIMNWLATQEHPQTRIIADYTGGTKTMSAGLAVAALDSEQVELQLVSGSRNNLVKIDSGNEQVIPASIETTRFKRRFSDALKPLAHYAYDEAVERLAALTVPRDTQLKGNLQRALALSQGLAAWDRFDHATAQNCLQPYRAKLGQAGFGQLFQSLELLNKPDAPAREPLQLFDLWRNAQRRAVQGRYDDAVARLYRLLEWSAQWMLREQAGIETVDVPADRVPPEMELSRNRKGQLQAGLFNAWALAAHYGSTAIQTFWEAQSAAMLDLLAARNLSILAHGFTPLDEKNWHRFESWCENQLLPLLLGLSQEKPYRIGTMPPQLPNYAL